MPKIHNMTKSQQPAYPLRMPDDLREAITAVAKRFKRSVNAQIVTAIQAYLNDLKREEWETSPEAQEMNDAAPDWPPSTPFSFGKSEINDLAHKVDQLERVITQQHDVLARVEALMRDGK